MINKISRWPKKENNRNIELSENKFRTEIFDQMQNQKLKHIKTENGKQRLYSWLSQTHQNGKWKTTFILLTKSNTSKRKMENNVYTPDLVKYIKTENGKQR